jgi:hypothetical protein
LSTGHQGETHRQDHEHEHCVTTIHRTPSEHRLFAAEDQTAERF